MNLILNNGIAQHKDAETTMILHLRLEGGGKEYQKSSGGALSPFGEGDFIRNRIRQRAAVQVAISAMSKQIGGMEPLIYVERKRRPNTASRFIQIKIHIVIWLSAFEEPI
jgi:hypothetical protein